MGSCCIIATVKISLHVNFCFVDSIILHNSYMLFQCTVIGKIMPVYDIHLQQDLLWSDIQTFHKLLFLEGKTHACCHSTAFNCSHSKVFALHNTPFTPVRLPSELKGAKLDRSGEHQDTMQAPVHTTDDSSEPAGVSSRYAR